MSRISQAVAVAVVASLAFLSSTVQANHLDNPNQLINAGFEDPIANTADPFIGRWQPFSLDGDEVAGADTAQTGTTMPRTDAAALELAIADLGNSFAGVFQDVPFPASFAGADAWFSGWHKEVSGNPGGSEIRIEWRDAATEISRTSNLAPSIGSDYEEFVLSAQVPAGATIARVVYAIQSFGGVNTQQVFVDDLNFNVAGLIPEPTSACLAVFACVTMASLRRRS